LLDGVDTVVHLGATFGPELDGTGTSGVDVDGSHRLLDAAGDAGVRTLVVLSTAMVYGAWSNNPVPLTEEDPVRPNDSLPFAVRKAEVERLTRCWRRDHEGATAAVLRPTIALADESSAWMARSLWSTGRMGGDDLGPPAQFVHLDDLASAVDLARRSRLDGVYNVAPDGWIPPEQLDALAGPGRRVRLPGPVASVVARIRWRFGLTPTPPAILPYTTHPWVVANDRLRAAGWQPANTNEEAFVAGNPGGPLSDVSSKRRQDLALGVVAAASVLLVAGVVVGVRLLRHRRGG
jgi:nucleoside-diphosphate-sugar epimerase